MEVGKEIGLLDALTRGSAPKRTLWNVDTEAEPTPSAEFMSFYRFVLR